MDTTTFCTQTTTWMPMGGARPYARSRFAFGLGHATTSLVVTGISAIKANVRPPGPIGRSSG